MTLRPKQNLKNRTTTRHNGLVRSRSRGRMALSGKRARGVDTKGHQSFIPPEDWYEPTDQRGSKYQIVVQPAGVGYRRVVTPDDIRRRLSELPERMVEALEVIQLSQMTRKKKVFPCYGMQWGTTLYLYPIEDGLTEYFNRPPRPQEHQEAIMYGGRWEQNGTNWKLIWTEDSIRNFYLNNVLIHELGHLLDDRNTGYLDRERYAEWFAIEHGYKASRRKQLAQRAVRKIVRRHHAT
jgi:hypothetical protein